MWSAITTSIFKIVEYILSIWSNKAKNTELTENEKAKKKIEDEDKFKQLIDKALSGDEEALDEIRKRLS